MSKAIRARITGKLHRNFRDTGAVTKVLLTEITGVDRDHMWIELTDAVMAFVPRTNRRTRNITFDCKLKEYVTYRPEGITTKLGASSLANIR